MNHEQTILSKIKEPLEYFKGIGTSAQSLPTDLFMFTRWNKHTLQQSELKNRSHHRFVLIFNFETMGQVHIDNFCIPFQPGQAVLICPYQFHHYSRLTSGQLAWLFCTFELQPESRLEPLRNRTVTMSDKSLNARNVLIEYWLNCQTKRTSGNLKNELLQTALFHLLLLLQIDGDADRQIIADTNSNELLSRVNRFLSEHQRNPVTIADVAENLNLSPSRLRYSFKKTSGVSLGSYILNYRINRSITLLRTTHLSVAEVATEVGFASPQTFCRIFKQKTGQTARSYRT